ncbi:MAG TPA: hypothetical protein VGH20_16000 [Myxococcales bacterium]
MRHRTGMSEQEKKEARTETQCLHERAVRLGSNPGMTFARCVKCATVLVSDGTARIAIAPLRKAG